jgi:thiol:disulfide interchange protein DsbG
MTKKTAIIYVAPDGKYLLSGLLFDGEGNNLTTAQYESYVPKPDQNALLKDAERTAWIEDGRPDAKAVIYALGEPHCGYCKLFYQQTRAAVTKGDLAIRWIMIGFDFEGKQAAANMFTAADPARVLYETFAKSQSGKLTSAFVPMSVAMSPRPASEAPAQAVARNEGYAAAHNMGGTPYIVYKTAGGSVEGVPGAPPPQQLAEILKVASR